MQLQAIFILTLWFWLTLPHLGIAQKTEEKDLTADEYIALYKNIAIQEMERSGIPASITLAQGIHESAFGNSTLARQSNNHFGIKCTKDWQGETTLKWDDEAQKSCFRVYTSAEDSYVDHTDFLLNRKHYAFLFEYDRKDYKSWAKGLRKAGYATDPQYPDKLIATIDKYKLFDFDKVTGLLTFDTTLSPIKDLPIYASTRKPRTKPRSFLFKALKPILYHENGTTYAVSRKGESALAAAKRFGIPYQRFLKFNDLQDGDILLDYQPVYIHPKKTTYKGEQTFYKVENDVTMYEIAQRYALKLSSLLTQNLMVEGEEPLNGELIMLKEKAITKPKLRASNHIDTLPSPYIDEETENNIKTNPTPTPVKVTVPIVERPQPQELKVNTPTYSPAIYADTTTINTAKSTDKEYLDIKITADDNTPNNNSNSTTTVYNPYISNDSEPINKTTNTTNNTTNTTNNNTSNIDDRAIFDPYKSSSEPKTETTINNPPKSNTDIPLDGFDNVSSPRINDKSTYGSTKNSSKVDTPQPIPNNNKIHVVQKGETLYRIHKLYNVPIETLQKLNNLTSNTINIGDRLIISLAK